MDDSILDPRGGSYTEITLRIPDDLARRLGAAGDIERRVLETLALDEFRQGHLNRAELRQLLGFATRAKLDEFLTVHGVSALTRQRIWSATVATCNGSASDRACGLSSPTPVRFIIWC